MESPVTAAKAALNPSAIIKTLFGVLVLFAILDVLGWTDYILYPVRTAKAKFGRQPAS